MSSTWYVLPTPIEIEAKSPSNSESFNDLKRSQIIVEYKAKNTRSVLLFILRKRRENKSPAVARNTI